MQIRYEYILSYLNNRPEGVFLDEMLLDLNIELSNNNRLKVVSYLQWKKEIKKKNVLCFGRVRTKYQIIKS
ncbi:MULTISPECIES: hypothetical protein [Enterococcus]|uniref:hypothetical protein n=1 Tax=Enterococcus TaxID=1350 RepID=UPI000DE9B8BC|nr:hypothetical protein [Enterococcus faecalis]EGO8064551.1 hypothetical protein [Enterococcus faecalis]EHA7757425.1 hypothetical protein [Enterococcus faecalis]EHK9427670.1 hypothetical protein [Enterococcus faecalis]EHZ9175958.1 hypothetical protein [Enterococcus faecalis]EKQ3638588.1 hypothetical protein [Enterococcus faecalis]